MFFFLFLSSLLIAHDWHKTLGDHHVPARGGSHSKGCSPSAQLPGSFHVLGRKNCKTRHFSPNRAKNIHFSGKSGFKFPTKTKEVPFVKLAFSQGNGADFGPFWGPQCDVDLCGFFWHKTLFFLGKNAQKDSLYLSIPKRPFLYQTVWGALAYNVVRKRRK